MCREFDSSVRSSVTDSVFAFCSASALSSAMAGGSRAARTDSSSAAPSDGVLLDGSGSMPTSTPMVWLRHSSGNASTVPLPRVRARVLRQVGGQQFAALRHHPFRRSPERRAQCGREARVGHHRQAIAGVAGHDGPARGRNPAVRLPDQPLGHAARFDRRVRFPDGLQQGALASQTVPEGRDARFQARRHVRAAGATEDPGTGDSLPGERFHGSQRRTRWHVRDGEMPLSTSKRIKYTTLQFIGREGTGRESTA